MALSPPVGVVPGGGWVRGRRQWPRRYPGGGGVGGGDNKRARTDHHGEFSKDSAGMWRVRKIRGGWVQGPLEESSNRERGQAEVRIGTLHGDAHLKEKGGSVGEEQVGRWELDSLWRCLASGGPSGVQARWLGNGNRVQRSHSFIRHSFIRPVKHSAGSDSERRCSGCGLKTEMGKK